jgi:hypothetical protein
MEMNFMAAVAGEIPRFMREQRAEAAAAQPDCRTYSIKLAELPQLFARNPVQALLGDSVILEITDITEGALFDRLREVVRIGGDCNPVLKRLFDRVLLSTGKSLHRIEALGGDLVFGGFPANMLQIHSTEGPLQLEVDQRALRTTQFELKQMMIREGKEKLVLAPGQKLCLADMDYDALDIPKDEELPPAKLSHLSSELAIPGCRLNIVIRKGNIEVSRWEFPKGTVHGTMLSSTGAPLEIHLIKTDPQVVDSFKGLPDLIDDPADLR